MTLNQHFNFYITSCHTDGGIYLCAFDGEKAEISNKIPLDRPMYAIRDRKKLHILLREAFSDGTSGYVCYDEEKGELSKPVSTGGIVACHLCVFKDRIYAANYLSGSISRLPDKTALHSGKGVNPIRQDMPHTHYVNSFDGRFLLCCDLGTDEIYTYDENLTEISRAKVPDGHGARHLASDGSRIFCANELKSTISVFDYTDGILSLKKTASLLPEDFSGESTAAAIRICGEYIYVSNRGHDSISVLTKDLKLVTTVSCGGKSPRDFNIFGDHLICTNELSDNITFFRMKNGIPSKLEAELTIKSPLCVTE